MKDPLVESKVVELKEKVDEINKIMLSLHANKIEVRLQYKFEENQEKIPTLSIWRCTGHDDYLQ